RIYNEVFESGYFGVIRFVPLDGAGFLIDDRIVTAHLAYSTDTDTETDFLDVGDPRIVYLSPEERPTFQGTVIGGICCRLPGTGQRARFSLYLPSSQFLCTKEITVPWASEAELRTLVYIGITPGFTDGHPTASIVGNERQEGEPTQCRIDSLWARPQP
ncbi:hypothetical protein KJ815_07335, partial [bacterium]|nr:hypothetical protein [bacterium]